MAAKKRMNDEVVSIEIVQPLEVEKFADETLATVEQNLNLRVERLIARRDRLNNQKTLQQLNHELSVAEATMINAEIEAENQELKLENTQAQDEIDVKKKTLDRIKRLKFI